MNQDFQGVLSALLRAGARFLVVGAHAMAVHGAPGSDLKQIGGVIWEIRLKGKSGIDRAPYVTVKPQRV